MTKRTLSTQAQAAKRIRTDLKRAFPGVKFSVKSESFAGGNAVDISWIDGPTDSQVSAITNQYQYGSFDGMIDMYENTNSRDDIPQAKYVQTSRGYSSERRAQAEAIAAEWDSRNSYPSEPWEIDRKVGMTLSQQSMVCACGTNPELGDVFCGECGSPLQDDERRAQEYEREEAQEAGVDAYLKSIITA